MTNQISTQYLELDQSDAFTVPADDEGGGFPSAGFDLHGAGDGLPHLGLTGGDVYKEQESGLKSSSAFIQQILTFIYKKKSKTLKHRSISINI